MTNDTAAKHVIAYYWDAFDPVVLLYNSQNNSIDKLGLTQINFSASENKICTGKMEDDEYIPCPQQVKLTKNTTCMKCSSPAYQCWNAFLNLDARGNGAAVLFSAQDRTLCILHFTAI